MSALVLHRLCGSSQSHHSAGGEIPELDSLYSLCQMDRNGGAKAMISNPTKPPLSPTSICQLTSLFSPLFASLHVPHQQSMNKKTVLISRKFFIHFSSDAAAL